MIKLPSRLLSHAARALAGTSGFSAEERRLILDILRPGRARTDEAAHLQAAVEGLSARDFVWPELERWRALLAERRWLLPPLPLRATAEARRAYRRQKLRLLLVWLRDVELARTEAQAALVRYARRGVRAHVTRQGDGAPCPVCDPLDRRAVGDDPRLLPPFHPGCRCLVLAASATPSRTLRAVHFGR